jgi:transcription-repair coupling factor (superfamily II helicase)
MRDLEIRGAGNLLGGEQSGHIAAVGFDLYVEMVTEAVDELTGQEHEHPQEVQIDVPVTAHLPREYIARDDVRMEAYRRLASVTTADDVDDIRSEWLDRYGPPPPPAEALLEVARLRAECVRLGVQSVSVQKGIVRFEGLQLRKSQEIRLKRLSPRASAVDGHVVVPLAGNRQLAGNTSVVTGLLTLLAEIAPPETAPAENAGAAPVTSGAP